MTRQLWIMLACGTVIVLIVNGIRMTFGVFLKPISLDMGISREAYGLVIAGQALLFGLVQPFAGMAADRYGAFRTILFGATLYVSGLWLASAATSPADLHLSLGLLVGIGLSASASVVVLGAIGKLVPDHRRGVVFGTVIASGSLGMFLLVPAAAELIGRFGWRESLALMAILVAVTALLAIGLRIPARSAGGAGRQPFREATNEAVRHRGFVLLTLGFFVCGFHVAFISTHFPAYLADSGVSPAAASYALAVIGLCNIIGAYGFGALGDRLRKKSVLTAIYVLRAALMSVILVAPMTDITAIAFGACMGLIWLSTVPLTSGIVAQVFGPQHFSFLFGIVFMSHQFGAFAGAWLGGRIHDATGTYDAMWAVSIGLALISAALHWPIDDRPLARLMAPSHR